MRRTASPAPPLCIAHEILHFGQFAGVDDIGDALGLDRATLEDQEATVPITVYYDALELAAARSGKPNFGLRFAVYWTRVAQGGLGSMHFLMLSSRTLRVACERILHYQRFWNPAEWYSLHEGKGTFSVRYRSWGPPREAHVHQAEKTAALTVLVPRGVDPSCVPLAVRFPHAPRGDGERLRRVLGVTPTFGAPWTEITLPSDVMDKPLPSANPGLFNFLDRYLSEQLAQLPQDDQSCAARARSTVQRLLHEPGFDQKLVARSMGLGTRTLARRLSDEGTSLREIVDAVRKSRAETLLEARMSIGEVAFLLGYSERAAFLHAFRRWHGTTPKAWLESRMPPPAGIGRAVPRPPTAVRTSG